MAAKRSIRLTGKAKTIIPDYTVAEWNGLNTFIKDPTELGDGQSPDSVNWITGRYKDNISLRRGYALLGKTRRTGTGRITGLGIGTRQDSTQVPFFTYGQKINYYDSVADDTKEVNTTNILPIAANNEDVSVMPYKSITGDHCYFTSPHSSIYKIEVANPGDVLDLGSTQFRGHAAINTNRMFLWKRNDAYGQKYTSVIYISVSEGNYTLSQYTQSTGNSIGTGNGTTKNYTGTLPAIPSKSTVFNVEVAGPIAAGTSVTAITKANVAQVTSTAHGLSVGDAVYITGVSGMTQINNVIGIVDTVIDANNVTISINTSAFTAYTSGGTMYKCEYWNDDKNGNMVSSAGGTGTINYTTGAYNITFITAPIAATIYAQYYSENSTSGGVADFTGTGSAVYNEFDGGGDITTIIPFDQVQYAFHLLTTWALNINNSTPSNIPYRSTLGTPYLLGAYTTDDGIMFLDNSVPSMPQIKTLAVSMITASAAVVVVPELISQMLDLTSFGFNQVAMFRWSEYDLMACAPSQNGVVGSNNAGIFVRNIYSNQYDYIDIPASCFVEYNGTLLSGDSLSNNLWTLFSGFDDDGANINNHWTGKMFNLGVAGLKKSNRFVIRGLIQSTQSININFSFDSAPFVTFFTVEGNGSYVNTGNPVTVGSSTIGSNVVGGGGDVITAYPFEVEFIVNADTFEYVQPQFEATGIGYVQIDNFTFKDNRFKGRRVLPTRTANSD